MLVFCIKQLLSLKQAILGRREPHQLAWGLALGVWLGVVPYGNLVALAILLFILSVRVNHGMVAVTAVAMSLVAALFDAQAHAVGRYVLTHPQYAPQLATAWQWPLVPWTDLNNTVVMGGLLLGLAAVVPAYLLSYPLFRYLAPPAADLPSAGEGAEQPVEPCEPAVAAMAAAEPSAAAPVLPTLPLRAEAVCAAETVAEPIHRSGDEPAAAASTAAGEDLRQEVPARAAEPLLALVDTQIEVVRLVEAPAASESPASKPVALLPAPALPPPAAEPRSPVETAAEAPAQANPPMSEALNYLLRQLRDSRQRRAA